MAYVQRDHEVTDLGWHQSKKQAAWAEFEYKLWAGWYTEADELALGMLGLDDYWKLRDAGLRFDLKGGGKTTMRKLRTPR